MMGGCLGNGVAPMRKVNIQQMQQEGHMATINARVQVPGGKCKLYRCTKQFIIRFMVFLTCCDLN